mmetsp:Transcript_18054/g.63436  ORF Transcript_18054/g.63436 Transcript_18054/m.63436 type:complete len:244 (+) Transcript_18054:880-1611(+)
MLLLRPRDLGIKPQLLLLRTGLHRRVVVFPEHDQLRLDAQREELLNKWAPHHRLVAEVAHTHVRRRVVETSQECCPCRPDCRQGRVRAHKGRVLHLAPQRGAAVPESHGRNTEGPRDMDDVLRKSHGANQGARRRNLVGGVVTESGLPSEKQRINQLRRVGGLALGGIGRGGCLLADVRDDDVHQLRGQHGRRVDDKAVREGEAGGLHSKGQRPTAILLVPGAVLADDAPPDLEVTGDDDGVT